MWQNRLSLTKNEHIMIIIDGWSILCIMGTIWIIGRIFDAYLGDY